MLDRYADRTAEILQRFEVAQGPDKPVSAEPLPEQALRLMKLNDNMTHFGVDLWSGWTNQKIPVGEGGFCAIRDADDRLNVLMQGRENRFWQSANCQKALWSDWFTPNNLSSSQYDSMTGKFFAARFGGDGQLVIFVQGIDGYLWDFWSSPNSLRTKPWSFKRLEMCTSSEFFAIERCYGGLEVFAIGLDGSVWHSWTMDYDNDKWSQWESIGGVASQGLYLNNNTEGYPELLVCDPSGSLWTIRHYTNGWHDWKRLGNAMSGRCVNVPNAGGGMDVYGIGLDQKLYRISRPTLDGEWGQWECLGGQFKELVDAVLLEGMLHLCLIGIDHRLWRLNKSGSFDDLGGSLSHACLGVNTDGDVLAIGCGFDAYLYCRKI